MNGFNRGADAYARSAKEVAAWEESNDERHEAARRTVRRIWRMTVAVWCASAAVGVWIVWEMVG